MTHPIAIIFTFAFGLAVGLAFAYQALKWIASQFRVVDCVTCDDFRAIHERAGAAPHCGIEEGHLHVIVDTRFSKGQLLHILASADLPGRIRRSDTIAALLERAAIKQPPPDEDKKAS